MGLDPGIVLVKILAVVALVLLNGFFVAAEFALVKVRDTQLEALVRQGHRRARRTRQVLDRLDRALSACQLGVTLASLGLGWIGEPVFSTLLSPVFDWLGLAPEQTQARHTIAFVVGFSLITYLHITAGEQAPKWLAIQRALPTALWVAGPLEWFRRLTAPAIWLVNWTSLWLLRQIGIQPQTESELVHTPEELRLLLAAAQKRAGATPLGHAIVLNALELHQRVVRDVMRPRHEIVSLSTEAGIAECLDIAERTRFSRFPLCEGGDLDRSLGVVHLKDLYAMRLKARRGADLLPVARKIVYVPETARLEKLLQLLLERKLHLAIVVDEYGGTVGLVTLENVLEELVGQIQDEFDQEKPLLVNIGPDTWEAQGALPVHQLEELVGQPLAQEGITTTSGWVTHQLGGFPKVGDVVGVGGFELRVEAVDEMRVARLLVRKVNPTGAAPAPSSST
jgi:CBS domain containing-hemolysin-like protein